jgi:hypothetical protein
MHSYLHSRQERPIRQVGSELDADQVAISRSDTKTLLEILLEAIITVREREREIERERERARRGTGIGERCGARLDLDAACGVCVPLVPALRVLEEGRRGSSRVSQLDASMSGHDARDELS